MASIRKKDQSKYWFACFTLPDGRRVTRSTKSTDRREALRIAVDMERATERGKTVTQVRRVIQELYEEVNGENIKDKSVSEFLDDWLKRKEVEIAESSHVAYVAVVKDFKRYMGQRQNIELALVKPSDIAGFRDMLAKNVTPGTANKKLKILRSAFKAAWQDELIVDNPADRVSTLKTKRNQFERRAFSLQELKRLLHEAHGEWKGMILFGLYTGQRLGDIATLTWQNLDLETSELRIYTDKTGRRQVIPIAKPLIEFISSMQVGDDPKAYLFPECASVIDTKGRASMLSAQFYEIMVAAGLAKKRGPKQAAKSGRAAKRENNELSFHSLRHSATSIMKNAGVSPAVVQEFIGHDSKAISQNYTHIEIEAMRRAADLMPDVLDSPPDG